MEQLGGVRACINNGFKSLKNSYAHERGPHWGRAKSFLDLGVGTPTQSWVPSLNQLIVLAPSMKLGPQFTHTQFITR